MTQEKRNKLIPGEALIYERSNGVVYARYRDPPWNQIEPWVIGGDPDSVDRANGNLFNWGEWQNMMRVADKNPTLKNQMKKLLDIYYLIKDDK